MGNLQASLPQPHLCGLNLCSRHQASTPEESAPASKSSPVACPLEPPKYSRIRNWQTGTILYDTLSARAVKEVPCSGQRCLGSIMFPKQMVCGAGEGSQPHGELLCRAQDFLHQYYCSMKR
ncbi:hypothetical protein lerEdw1_020435 [Lerista edwardsae]|nr:hypothetical protein lerEdw1_020435 [Lerista edwardsae]